MAKDAPIINILTYRLPRKLANQIYNEYENRLREANYFIDNIKSYKTLQGDKKTVELLLALSIFHKRVITNLDAAVKFYGTVTKYCTADTIKIGSYDLTGKEKNNILAVVMNYNQLIEKFSIAPIVMEYYETIEYLKSLILLKSILTNAADQERTISRTKRKNKTEDELPF